MESDAPSLSSSVLTGMALQRSADVPFHRQLQKGFAHIFIKSDIFLHFFVIKTVQPRIKGK